MGFPGIDFAIGFSSARAGVGKTTIVVELCAWFAARGHAVALLDADLGAPDALNRLRIAGSRGEREDVACFSLGRALEERGLAGVQGELLEQELARLFESELDFGRRELLLVDLAPGAEADEGWLEALGLDALVRVALESDESAPDSMLPVLGRIETFAQAAESKRGPRGATLLGRVRFDPLLRDLATRGRPLVLDNANGATARAIAKAGANLWKRVQSRLA